MEKVIPKISNYKDVIIYNSEPIYNSNFTTFEFTSNNRTYIFPYMETIIHNQNRNKIFSELNLLQGKKFISNLNTISVIQFDNHFYYCIQIDHEIIAYIKLFDYRILEYDCIPIYQKQGYIGILIRFLIKSGAKIIIDDSLEDLKTLIRLSKTMFRENSISLEYDKNQVIILCKDKMKLLLEEYEADKLSFCRRYSYHGIFSYTENYKEWKI